MQQLLALPRGASGQQQQQQAHVRQSQNELHFHMQQEAREHLKMQQQQQMFQKQNRQHQHEQLLWEGNQNVVPTPSFTIVSSPGTYSSPNVGMSVAAGLAASESSSPSAFAPTGKASGKSSACIIS
jgi:hypothetical protein